MIISGYIVVSLLMGKMEIQNNRIYQDKADCYVALHWPKTEGDKAKYSCYFITGKEANLTVTEEE